MFNDTSCVSCHNQGGIGGGGAEAKNVFVITAVRTNFNRPVNAGAVPQRGSLTLNGQSARVPAQSNPSAEPKAEVTPEEQERKQLLDELRALHPGLVTARSVVLHRSGTDPKYAAWRDQALGLNAVGFMNNFVPPASVSASSVTVPGPSTGGGFFAELAAQAQQSVILELQPPNDLLAEKGRSLLSRFAIIGNAQAFAGPRGPGQQVVRSLAAIPT